LTERGDAVRSRRPYGALAELADIVGARGLVLKVGDTVPVESRSENN